MTKVKICGIMRLSVALKACELGADVLGFVFYEKSPRKLEEGEAQRIIRGLPKAAVKVGLFLDQKSEDVKRIATHCGLDFLQLHGSESPAYSAALRKDFKIIKSFRVSGPSSVENANSYSEADYYLFDTYVKGVPGATGKSFDWEVLSGRKFKKPIFLAGGLTPENVQRAIGRVAPYAVDTSSGVEESPGKKGHKLLKEFIDNAKKTYTG